jgi:predicted transcriptional regulator
MRRDVTVREVMDDAYVGVSESDDLLETVELLLSEGAPVAIVLQGGDAVGVCAPRNVLALLVEGGDPASSTVGDAMTDRVHTIRPDRSIAEARGRMTARAAGWLVVTGGEGPMGVVTEQDLLAGSALGGETAAEGREGADVPAAVAESNVGEASAETAATGAFEDQGICEVCGSLTHDLAAFNGQLRCADCRTV